MIKVLAVVLVIDRGRQRMVKNRPGDMMPGAFWTVLKGLVVFGLSRTGEALFGITGRLGCVANVGSDFG